MNFDGILWWHWWVAGLVLLTLEALVPGAIFLWMGISAIVVGALTWLVGLSWQWAFVIFGVLSIASIVAWRRWRPHTVQSDKPTLNRRGHSYVGRTFTLAEPIVNGVGRLRVDDSQWRINGPDAPVGAQVTVVAADGATLRVERSD